MPAASTSVESSTSDADGPVPGRSGEVTTGKGERTRSAILAAAIQQFASVGSRGASVPAIARAVDVSPSTVYSYFPSKSDLFIESVDEDVAGLIADALPEIADGGFDGDFASVFTKLLDALDEHPLARRVLEGNEAEAAPRLKVLPAELQLRKGIATALQNGQANGTVRADIDPMTHAAGLEAVVIALLMSLVQTNGEIDSQYAIGAIAVLEAAIRPM